MGPTPEQATARRLALATAPLAGLPRCRETCPARHARRQGARSIPDARGRQTNAVSKGCSRRGANSRLGTWCGVIIRSSSVCELVAAAPPAAWGAGEKLAHKRRKSPQRSHAPGDAAVGSFALLWPVTSKTTHRWVALPQAFLVRVGFAYDAAE